MEQFWKKSTALRSQYFKRRCDQVIHSVLSLLQYYIAPKGYTLETSVVSVTTELKSNFLGEVLLGVFFWVVSTSFESLEQNSGTTCFSSFLIFLAHSQIMHESLEKTMGHVRLECLVFTLRCVLKIPNVSLFTYLLLRIIHKSEYVNANINAAFYCGREKSLFWNFFSWILICMTCIIPKQDFNFYFQEYFYTLLNPKLFFIWKKGMDIAEDEILLFSLICLM